MNLNALMVRYIVDSIEASIHFYESHCGFRVAARSGPDFALLERDNLQLVLSPPRGPGGGSQPTGGWNRIIIRTASLDRDVEALRKAGVSFRSDFLTGPGGRQILVEDPSGNLVELFEPSTGQS